MELQILFLVLVLSLDLGQAQQATTDPTEGQALNSMFRRWGISANERQWNISGEVCSGAAVDNSTVIDDTNFNPFIKCDCTYQNSTTCHITRLKVYALNVVGTIPNELWTLSYLTNLNLGQNYLTGSLSSFISNLTQMEWLTMGINALSGELPRELGTLANLKLLGIGTNNFSGPLPRELGNCLELEQLYIDSSGVSGEIPPTFANLRNLATVWASDIELTGNIPAFIGNWSNLTSLRLQGNAFEGPIPSTFANLTSLTELRISGLTNGSSSLAFIRNMRSLSILDLRNSEILDTIPSDIGEYQRLTQLDLSFNNITGPIPASLFNLSSLTHLFLGNNVLNGTLPAEKSSSLLNIDLSYNFFSGSLPSWVNQNLSLNLVANNFVIDRSNSSGLPSGLNCLQRNFPCNRGSGIHSSFAVKCGGPQITSSDRTMFERENEMSGPASYYVTDERWAVSNVGYFTGTNNPQYTSSSTAQFANTLDTELYQTARISASSLRYYGLGLENGNYTVSLHFAETQFVDANRWQSLGKRIFDIYIQGRRVRKDFDIRNEAGGFSTSAAVRQFNTTVSENYLEVHLFWAGKGTCCVPAQGTYGPSISAISVTPGFRPTIRSRPNAKKNSRTGLLVGIIVGVGVVSCLAIVAFLFLRRRSSDTEDDELSGMDMKPYTFSYNELKTATDDFSAPNKLGEGGFGPVYKGKLNDGRAVAVKQLSVTSRQGKSQFISEIATISGVQHRNLVKLYGCCIEADQHLLVYEYLENKSLDKALFDRSLNLDWPTRFDVCMGVARGLAYLHEESRLRIVHRDVKSSNILLDVDLNPKISDFGLAKLYDDKMTHMSTRVAGTIGYLAPEYAMLGHLTEKTDVFAFGVVALELVSGRPNSDSSLGEDKMYLLEWAWELHETDREIELIDPCLSEHDDEQVKRMITVALLCTQASPSQRPAMSRVVAMLSGDLQVNISTAKPGYLIDWKFEEHLESFPSGNTEIMSSGTSYFTKRSTSMTKEDNKGASPILQSTMHVE